MDSCDRMTGGDRIAEGGAPEPGAAGPNAGKRAMPRDSLLLVGHCRLGDEPGVHEVRVRNLSEVGLMIELDIPADVGSHVWLDLPGIGEITGKVAWCAAGRMGIALDGTIDPKAAR